MSACLSVCLSLEWQQRREDPTHNWSHIHNPFAPFSPGCLIIYETQRCTCLSAQVEFMVRVYSIWECTFSLHVSANTSVFAFSCFLPLSLPEHPPPLTPGLPHKPSLSLMYFSVEPSLLLIRPVCGFSLSFIHVNNENGQNGIVSYYSSQLLTERVFFSHRIQLGWRLIA